jgi:hypothetical protein
LKAKGVSGLEKFRSLLVVEGKGCVWLGKVLRSRTLALIFLILSFHFSFLLAGGVRTD